MRLGALLAAVVTLAACGQSQAGHGQASLWVTRDRGAHVLLTTTVPAGISAMEALRRKAKVETRYGGRYVQAVDGIKGSLTGQRDWFYYVNGYEADQSAADYRLHDGDVLWWDYRGWRNALRQPVVVGAFPEPFVHGYGGHRRRAVVLTGKPDALARRVGGLVRGRVNGRSDDANILVLVNGSGVRADLSGGPGDPVRFTVGRRAAARLLRDRSFVRFRYAIP